MTIVAVSSRLLELLVLSCLLGLPFLLQCRCAAVVATARLASACCAPSIAVPLSSSPGPWGTFDVTCYKFDAAISSSSISWEHPRDFPAPTSMGATAWDLYKKASLTVGGVLLVVGTILRFPPRFDHGSITIRSEPLLCIASVPRSAWGGSTGEEETLHANESARDRPAIGKRGPLHVQDKVDSLTT